jgi:hypothetical protein
VGGEEGKRAMKRADPRAQIRAVCEEVKRTLLAKNRAYGNSALEPLRIFSRACPLEQINVRIDDKLSRLARGSEVNGDDTELDLIGYLVLRRVARKAASEEKTEGVGLTPTSIKA